MLGWRVLVSAILIPALVALFVLDHRAGREAPVLLVLCMLLAVRCVWEITPRWLLPDKHVRVGVERL